MTTPDILDVLIIGAGPTGLALALWLTRLGVKVRIVDRAAEPGSTSRAFVIHARTLELYDQLGIAQAVIARGLKISQVNAWVRARKVAAIPVGDFGAGLSPFPFALALPQNLHERLLIEFLEKDGVTVERPVELIDFDQSGAGVRARLRRGDGTGDAIETVEAAFLCGADGARSTVRGHLGVGFPGGTYPHTFYVADVEAQGPTANGAPNFCLDSHDLCAVFPIPGASNLRLIGVLPDLSSTETVTFESVAPAVFKKTQLEVSKVHWFSTYRVHHRVADQLRKGRVFLLGDAAHIHSPAGGQGMNTGIGDAANLAWKLAAVISGLHARTPETLLNTYETERIGFARQLVQSTDRAFSIGTSPGWLPRLLRMKAFPALAPLVMRLTFARRLVFLTLSQLRVQYRTSPISKGSAGRIHGGDRLPWTGGINAEGTNNFEPLRSLHWQLHVYGRPASNIKKLCGDLSLEWKVFPWQDAARRAGFLENAIYLVRPDGYIAFAGTSRDLDQIAGFFDSLSI